MPAPAYLNLILYVRHDMQIMQVRMSSWAYRPLLMITGHLGDNDRSSSRLGPADLRVMHRHCGPTCDH